MDTHADMTVLGSNCIVLGYTGKECKVSPYEDEYSLIQNIPVITGATVWTNPQDGTSIILVFNDALWMGDRLDHTLVNPNQMHAYGIDIQDNPFSDQPLSIMTGDHTVPLHTQGTTIFCCTRSPTMHELHNLPQIELTSHQSWEPHKVQFPTVEHPLAMALSMTNHLYSCDHCLAGSMYDLEHLSTCIFQQVQVKWPDDRPEQIKQDVPLSQTFQSRQ